MKSIRSIYFKNFLTIAAILGISFLILGVAFASFSYRLIIGEKREAVSLSADEATKVVSAYSTTWEFDSFDMKMTLSSLSSSTGFHILLCDTDGTVVSCSDRLINCPHIGASVPEEQLVSLRANGDFSGVSDLGGIYGEPRYTIGRTIEQNVDGSIVVKAYLFCSGNTKTMAEMWRQFSGIFSTVAMMVMLIAFIISLITTKKQAEPINEIAAAAHRFARGDFSVRVGGTERHDEIGDLAEAFNSMVSSLERSENMRRELIGNVSHELKTPMTTITGFADGILDGTIPKEQEEKYLRVISSETKRLSRLVKSMLQMSQVQAMNTENILKNSFDLSDVICEALLSLEKKINDKKLDVQVNLPENAIFVRGARDSIMQVVYNLTDNAIKFSPSGGVLRIDLWKQGGKAFVSVRNSGETISKEELPLIFDRFHKSDRSRSVDRDGVGLGLYIVKTILDNHNEDIYVTSQDHITTFTFTLSLSPDQGSAKDHNVYKKDKNN